jgi:hypothetical protein
LTLPCDHNYYWTEASRVIFLILYMHIGAICSIYASCEVILVSTFLLVRMNLVKIGSPHLLPLLFLHTTKKKMGTSKVWLVGWFMMLSATFINISAVSWLSVLLVEETGVPGENHRPVASHWRTLSYNVVSSTYRHELGPNSQLKWRKSLDAQLVVNLTTIRSRPRPWNDQVRRYNFNKI